MATALGQERWVCSETSKKRCDSSWLPEAKTSVHQGGVWMLVLTTAGTQEASLL